MIGAYAVFWPMHYRGMAGVPRRYYRFGGFEAFGTFEAMNQFITIAAIISFFAQFIFLYNFFYSIFYGKKSSLNPWKANTLEWTTPRVPGHGNWPGDIPKVFRWAYDYSKPGVKEDYLPQHIPDEEVEYEEGFIPKEAEPVTTDPKRKVEIEKAEAEKDNS